MDMDMVDRDIVNRDIVYEDIVDATWWTGHGGRDMVDVDMVDGVDVDMVDGTL